MSGILVLRLSLVMLTVALAGALIASGHVLVGVLVGALAVTRLAVFVVWRRRRADFARRFPRRWEKRT